MDDTQFKQLLAGVMSADTNDREQAEKQMDDYLAKHAVNCLES